MLIRVFLIMVKMVMVKSSRIKLSSSRIIVQDYFKIAEFSNLANVTPLYHYKVFNGMQKLIYSLFAISLNK